MYYCLTIGQGEISNEQTRLHEINIQLNEAEWWMYASVKQPLSEPVPEYH